MQGFDRGSAIRQERRNWSGCIKWAWGGGADLDGGEGDGSSLIDDQELRLGELLVVLGLYVLHRLHTATKVQFKLEAGKSGWLSDRSDYPLDTPPFPCGTLRGC